MKFFAYNDKLNVPNEFGSFTVVARKLNEQFRILDFLGDPTDPECFVIYPEVFETQQIFKKQIPYLACEYSLAPQIVIDRLKQYNPMVLCISQFAQNNLINSGYDNTDYVHLGTDPELWFPLNTDKDKRQYPYTYLTVNSSNDRSGFEKLIPSFIEFSKDKKVRLIIKDGKNPEFAQYINSLNQNNIIYIDDMLDEQQLKILYNSSDIFIYANNTTSFGMNPLDAALCGTPVLVTLGSAIKEFIPEWTQPVKIKTEMKEINEQSIDEWHRLGLKSFHKDFLKLFKNKICGERVIEQDIKQVLNYSFFNYKELLDINIEHRKQILENLTWEICAKKIMQKIKEYYNV
jgi:glycosyltransferase involved in cell wall biosynthesis